MHQPEQLHVTEHRPEVVPHPNPHFCGVVEHRLGEREVVPGHQPVHGETRVFILRVAAAGQVGRRRRRIVITGVLVGRPRSDSDESFVVFEIGVHPAIALFQRHPEVVGDRAVHLQLLCVLAQRRLADDRIALVGFLEESPADLTRFDGGDDLELTLVFQEFRQPLDDLVVGIRDGQLVNRVLEVAFRLTEMGLEQLDEFSSSLLVALLVGIDEQRGNRFVGRARPREVSRQHWHPPSRRRWETYVSIVSSVMIS